MTEELGQILKVLPSLKVKVLVAQLGLTLCDPMDCSLPGLSMEFSREESWGGLPFPSPGDLPNPRIEPALASSQILLSKYFREELKQRMWVRSVPGRPHRVLFRYITTL